MLGPPPPPNSLQRWGAPSPEPTSFGVVHHENRQTLSPAHAHRLPTPEVGLGPRRPPPRSQKVLNSCAPGRLSAALCTSWGPVQARPRSFCLCPRVTSCCQEELHRGIKVRGLQLTRPQRPGQPIAHRTSLYQFPWRANPVQGREDMESFRSSLSLSSLRAGCLESGMWPRGASSPPPLKGGLGAQSQGVGLSLPTGVPTLPSRSRLSLLGEAAL